MKIRWIQVLVAFAVFTGCSVVEASTDRLCGAELLDALQFVCGDRSFILSRLTGRSNSRRSQMRIVEECCFRGCNMQMLELYCASDILATSGLSPLTEEVPQKHVTVKYKRMATQRIRRGIPAILLSRTFQKQAKTIKAQEQAAFHRPLISLPSTLPPSLPPTENYVSYK